MTSRSTLLLATVVVGLGISGCGTSYSPTPSTEQTAKVSGKEALKKRLATVAETGIGGSGLAGIRESINELKASDAALAEQLLKDFNQLEKAEDTVQIKSLAQAMVGKL